MRLAYLCALVLCAAMTGCGGGSSVDAVADLPAPQAPPVQPAPVPPPSTPSFQVQALSYLETPAAVAGQTPACPSLVVGGFLTAVDAAPPVLPRVTRVTLSREGQAVWSGEVAPADNQPDGLGHLEVAARGCAAASLQVGQAVVASFDATYEGQALRIESAPMGLRDWRQLDVLDRMRTTLPNLDGRLDAVKQRIRQWGSAVVEVALNVESLDFDYERDGMRLHPPDPQEVRVATQLLLDKLKSSPRHGKPQPDPAVGSSANVLMRITLEDWDILRQWTAVRSMRLAGWTQAWAVRLDPDAVADARRDGQAVVIIALRSPHPYTPGTGYLSAGATQRQGIAMRRALTEILTPLGTGVVRYYHLGDLGGGVAVMTEQGLSQLFADPDPRLFSVDANKPVGVVGSYSPP